MSETSIQAGTVTFMTPVRRGEETQLLDALDQLQQDPFELAARGDFEPACGRTHFARFVVLDLLADEPPNYVPGRLDPVRLLFTASFDGPRTGYVEDLRRSIVRQDQAPNVSWANKAWYCCEGYPGAQSSAAFALYLQHHRIPTARFIAAYGNATVLEVKTALEIQASMRELAVAAQDLSDAEIQAAFLARFGS